MYSLQSTCMQGCEGGHLGRGTEGRGVLLCDCNRSGSLERGNWGGGRVGTCQHYTLFPLSGCCSGFVRAVLGFQDCFVTSQLSVISFSLETLVFAGLCRFCKSGQDCAWRLHKRLPQQSSGVTGLGHCAGMLGDSAPCAETSDMGPEDSLCHF